MIWFQEWSVKHDSKIYLLRDFDIVDISIHVSNLIVYILVTVDIATIFKEYSGNNHLSSS